MAQKFSDAHGNPDKNKEPRTMPGFQDSCSCCFLLASLRRSLGGLGRRVHCQFIGAHILEQDRAIRQVGLAQAGARRGDRADHRRRCRNRVVATDDVDRPTAMPVPGVMPAVVPHDRTTQPRVTPATNPVVANVDVAAEVNVPVEARDMPAVTVARMTDDTRMATHPVTAADDAATTLAMTAAAIRTRIGSSGGDERREADDGRGDESEECSTFEHGQRPFGSRWTIRGLVGERGTAGSSD